MNTRHASPLYTVPAAPAVRTEELKLGCGEAQWPWDPASDSLGELRAGCLTGPMVTKEFLRHRIAPLQDHKHPMWKYAGPFNKMRLQEEDLSSDTIAAVLQVLFGLDLVPNRPSVAVLLCRAAKRDKIVSSMPCIDQWGLLPADCPGLRDENNSSDITFQ